MLDVAGIPEAAHGRVDTVIANAGVCSYGAKVHNVPVADFQEHFSINVLGPLVLFQSIRTLLQASALPLFVAVSSGAGSLEGIAESGMDMAAYGTSKAALNWVTRKIHFENEWLIAFPQCPGPTITGMAKPLLDKNDATSDFLRTIMRQPDAVANTLVDIITTSTREKNRGQFGNIDGGRHPW